MCAEMFFSTKQLAKTEQMEIRISVRCNVSSLYHVIEMGMK